MSERMKAFATRALGRKDTQAHEMSGSAPASMPLRARAGSAQSHTPYKLVDERGAVVDTPTFREQLKHANDWAQETTARFKKAAKLLQDVSTLEAELAAAKKNAIASLSDIARTLTVTGFDGTARTLSQDVVQLAAQLTETETMRLTFVCAITICCCCPPYTNKTKASKNANEKNRRRS